MKFEDLSKEEQTLLDFRNQCRNNAVRLTLKAYEKAKEALPKETAEKNSKQHYQ